MLRLNIIRGPINFTLALLFFLTSTLSLAESVTATLDKQVVYESDVVQLTIRTDFPNTGQGPDLSLLKRDFDILSQSQNSQFRFNLGTSQSLSFWVISLMPKSTGDFIIPPIKVGDFESKPITLKVKTAQQLLDENGNPPVIIDLEVSQEQPYLQQELIISLKLYSAFALQNANISTPNHPNLVTERLADDQIHYEEVNGSQYQVITREYLAFPQQSGKLEIPPQKISAMINTNLGRRLIKAQSKAITLDVLPIPASYPSDDWLPATKVSLLNSLSPTSEVKVGDTLIWQIDAFAEGALPEQMPAFAYSSTRDYKLYPQPAKFNSRKTDTGITGEQSIQIEVVPTTPGKLVLPEIEILFWNTKTRQLERTYAVPPTVEVTGLALNGTLNNAQAKKLLAPQTGSVAPISLAKPKDKNLEPEQDPLASTVDLTINDGSQSWGLKKILIAILALIASITLMSAITLMVRKRKTTTDTKENDVPTLQVFAPLNTQDEKSAYQELIFACKSHDLKSLRGKSLEWARHRWGEDKINGLDDIKRLSESSTLSQLLMEAELIMYSNTGATDWDGSDLADALEEFYSGEAKPSQSSQLKTLYPNF
jgi:hypothetical protein